MTRALPHLFLALTLWGTGVAISAETPPEEPPPMPLPAPAPGTVTLANPAEADVARKKAKAYASEKNWKAAREEATKAIRLEVNHPDGWLILGIAEQRLERNAEARDAYRKYLSFNPSAEKGAPVRSRLAQVEVAADKLEKSEREGKEAKYGRDARGLTLGFAPLYRPKVSGSQELGDNATNAILLGYRFGEKLSLALRWHHGIMPTLKTTKTTESNVGAKLLAIEGQYAFVLNDPFDKFFGFQFFIPLNLQLYTNWVNGSTSIYMNHGFALGTGVGVRYYTRAPVIFDIQFLYHVAAPLTDIDVLGTDKVLNAAGTTEKGDASGPEFRLSATLVF